MDAFPVNPFRSIVSEPNGQAAAQHSGLARLNENCVNRPATGIFFSMEIAYKVLAQAEYNPTAAARLTERRNSGQKRTRDAFLMVAVLRSRRR